MKLQNSDPLFNGWTRKKSIRGLYAHGKRQEGTRHLHFPYKSTAFTKASSIKFGYFCTFKGKIVHQTFVGKNETDDWFFGRVGINIPGCPESGDGYTSINACLPTITVSELLQCLLGHKENDLRFDLRPELESDGAAAVL